MSSLVRKNKKLIKSLKVKNKNILKLKKTIKKNKKNIKLLKMMKCKCTKICKKSLNKNKNKSKKGGGRGLIDITRQINTLNKYGYGCQGSVDLRTCYAGL